MIIELLVSETNAPHLQQVVDTIIKGCLHPDFSVKNVLVVQVLLENMIRFFPIDSTRVLLNPHTVGYVLAQS